jgi:hypothetical protein
LVFADVCWVFSVALSGRVIYVPAAHVTKRYFPSSTSADWRFGVRQALSEWRTMSLALYRSAHPHASVLPAFAVVTYVAIARVLWRSMRTALGRSRQRAPAWLRIAALWPAGSTRGERSDRPYR